MMQTKFFTNEVLIMPDHEPFQLFGTTEPVDPALTRQQAQSSSEMRKLIFYAALLLLAFVLYEEWMRYSVNRENAQLRESLTNCETALGALPDPEAVRQALLTQLKDEGRLVEPPALISEEPKPAVVKRPPSIVKPKGLRGEVLDLYSGGGLLNLSQAR